jgi:hypothetical protein
MVDVMDQHHFGIDISTYNMRTTSTLAAKAAGLVATAPAPNMATEHNGRDHNPNAGRTAKPKGLMGVASGVQYIAPDFVTMRSKGWCHPEFVYIKAAHGTAGPGAPDQYPIASYITAAKAAKAAGWAFAPYFYYYMDMPVGAQVNCFWDSLVQACGGDLSLFGTMNPIIDLEDNTSTRYKSMLWDGKDSTMQAKRANAYDFFGDIFPLFLTELDKRFNANLAGKPGMRDVYTTQVYSGNWFIKPPSSVLRIGNYPANLSAIAFYNNRQALSAAYTTDHQPPATVTADMQMPDFDNRVIQFTSTSVPPMVGLNCPGMDGVMGSSLDINYYHADPSHYLYWTGLTKLLPAVDGTDPVTPPVEPPPSDTEARLKALEAARTSLDAEMSTVVSEIDTIKARLTKIENWAQGYKP